MIPRVAISQRLLNEGEHVVVSTRTHVKALLLPALWLILVAAVAGFVSTFPSGRARPLLVAVIWILALLVVLLARRRAVPALDDRPPTPSPTGG